MDLCWTLEHEHALVCVKRCRCSSQTAPPSGTGWTRTPLSPTSTRGCMWVWAAESTTRSSVTARNTMHRLTPHGCSVATNCCTFSYHQIFVRGLIIASRRAAGVNISRSALPKDAVPSKTPVNNGEWSQDVYVCFLC